MWERKHDDWSIHFGTASVSALLRAVQYASWECFLNESGERNSAGARPLRWLGSSRTSLFLCFVFVFFLHSRLRNLGKCFKFCCRWVPPLNLPCLWLWKPTVGSGQVLTVVCTFWHWSDPTVIIKWISSDGILHLMNVLWNQNKTFSPRLIPLQC